MNKDVKVIIGRILNDLRVELGDEFNRNFERQAFFSGRVGEVPPAPAGISWWTAVSSGAASRAVQRRTVSPFIPRFLTRPFITTVARLW